MSLLPSRIQFRFRLPQVGSGHTPHLPYVSTVALWGQGGAVLTKWSLRPRVHVLIPLTKCYSDAVIPLLFLEEEDTKFIDLNYGSSMMSWKRGDSLAHGIRQDRWGGSVTLG